MAHYDAIARRRLWQTAAASFRDWRQHRRTLRDLERLDPASRREFELLLEFARGRPARDQRRSKRATSSR